MKRILGIALAQLNFLVGDMAGNAEKIIDAAARARDELGADLVAFPELALSGYPPEDLLLRPGLHMEVLRALEQVKRSVRGIDALVGFPEQTGDGLYNAAVWLRDGEVLGVCRKQHLPNYSVFDEKRYFVSGAEACVVAIKGVRVGVSICEDIWMPEPILQAARAGAQLIVNINASPYHVGRRGEREAVLRQRATESGLPIVYLNLVGGQDELVFDGGSMVVDAAGVVTASLPACEEILSTCEFEIAPDVRPLPGDVMPRASEEAEIYRALVLGVRDYIEKNRFRGVVIGLSGGIDSALTLALAVDALGAGRVEGISMPSRYTADMSIEDARAEAEILGVSFGLIPIEPAFRAFLDCLSDEFAGLATDVTEENIQARCRGVILMAVANKKRRIVLTTGNKSEMAVGYATLYGDMAGGFAAIKDVPKQMVYRLAHYRNSLGQVIPERVLSRAPSAELAPDQKDEDSLPPYAILDPILERYVERDESVDDIVAAGFDPATVRRVADMVDRNEYKRRQAAPGVRITRRAFGRDRRYPITSGYRRKIRPES